MKHIYLIIAACLLLAACSKSGTNNPTPDPSNPNGNATTGNTTDYKGYVVKTIGVNMMLVGVDKNYKITNAYLYGGGNKIILKAGTGNKAEISPTGLSTCPDEVTNRPDGTFQYAKVGIDNGKMLDTTGGSGTVIKLRGFDKAKTGYNQLNVVFCNFLWDSYVTGGYYNNVIFTKFEKQAGKKNSDYSSSDFVGSMINGNINVFSVELAPPVLDNTYIVEDQVVFNGLSSYNQLKKQVNNVDFSSSAFRFLAVNKYDFATSPVANGIISEWVNADKGTVSGSNGVYAIKFDNIKTGDKDMVIDPADTLNRVFLRVKGFDRKIFGFNALRLFIGYDSNTKGEIQIYLHDETGEKLTLEAAKKMYLVQGLFGYQASPIWPHY